MLNGLKPLEFIYKLQMYTRSTYIIIFTISSKASGLKEFKCQVALLLEFELQIVKLTKSGTKKPCKLIINHSTLLKLTIMKLRIQSRRLDICYINSREQQQRQRQAANVDSDLDRTQKHFAHTCNGTALV